MTLDEIIKKLRKAKGLLKRSIWSSQDKRDAKAVGLIDGLLADPQLPSDIKQVIKGSRSQLLEASSSSSPLARTTALLSLTSAIEFVKSKALLPIRGPKVVPGSGQSGKQSKSSRHNRGA
jgi:hypothetical protein